MTPRDDPQRDPQRQRDPQSDPQRRPPELTPSREAGDGVQQFLVQDVGLPHQLKDPLGLEQVAGQSVVTGTDDVSPVAAVGGISLERVGERRGVSCFVGWRA